MRPNDAGIRTAGPGRPGERARGPDARAPTRGCPRVLAASAHTDVCFPLGSPAKSCGGSGPAKGRSIRNAHEMLFGPHPQASTQIVLVPCAAQSGPATRSRFTSRSPAPRCPQHFCSCAAAALPPPCPSCPPVRASQAPLEATSWEGSSRPLHQPRCPNCAGSFLPYIIRVGAQV